jgi:replication factor C subunit 2/4
MVFQHEACAALARAVETQNLPHLLLYGPPGTGKTSLILAAARDLFGPALFKDRVLELNASDERGINVIRTKVKKFAQTAVANVAGRPPFKIIILDEADNMTTEAQAALRRTMEEFSRVTRFCLVCNYVSRIIDPIASRCAKFRFKPLSEDSLKERLVHVASMEGVRCSPEAIHEMVVLSQGDLRKAITLLQSAHRIYPEHVGQNEVREIAGVMPMEKTVALSSTLGSLRSYEAMEKTLASLMKEGYSGSAILRQLVELLASGEAFGPQAPPEKQVAVARALVYASEREKAMADGGDEYLQLLDFCAYVQRVAQERIVLV